MQYMTGLSIMEQTVHLHPHIGVCRFEKFDYKSVAFDYFQSAVKMGLEGLIVVDPRVPYNFNAQRNEPTRFYKMKPKTVTKQFIKLMKENEKEEWKDGGKEKVSEYTVNVEGHDVTFVDMQRNREGHKVRIKWILGISCFFLVGRNACLQDKNTFIGTAAILKYCGKLGISS
jgi:hypothetical protein